MERTLYETNNNFYKDLSSDLIVERFNHLDIVFDPKWQKIGVNLSGGADSALLTFMLCEIISKHGLQTKVNVITYQRCWETRPWQGYVSLQVFNKLKDMYPTIIQDRITTYIPPELEHGVIGPIVNGRSGDQIIVGSFNKFAAWHYNLDAVFNATSKNPDDSRSDRMKNRDKDANDGSLQDVWIEQRGKVLAHPFRFVKKDWIVAQYFLYKVEDLYYTTRSCEGDIEQHNIIKQACDHYSKYEDGMQIPECGQCWWCEERNWAESRLEQMIQEINNG